MAREIRKWHPNFIKYMEMIATHPNYRGLPIEKRADGSYSWIATAKSDIGKRRIAWCEQKASELGLPVQAGVYADVMLAIHPTKRKVCQTCGKEMSLYYHYPNAHFLKSLNKRFATDYTFCDHISDIWDDLVHKGVDEGSIAQFLIEKGKLSIRSDLGKHRVIEHLELECRKGNRSCLGPGAMSNFPDRFDGFHTYNRCCRASQDKGRSADNLRSYSKDRRAYEYWSDGNIHAADQFMKSEYFMGTSADHIGPISLGFVHDPRYLQPMSGGDNSAKRDRLQVIDIEKIIEVERRTGVYPMSWYSRDIWEHIKANYAASPHKVGTIYRDALKQNMSNFMYVLWYIMENCPRNGKPFLVEAILAPQYKCFAYDYTFNARGEIIGQTPRRFTGRSDNEFVRQQRIAIDAVYDYMDKENRNVDPDLISDEHQALELICGYINRGMPLEDVFKKLRILMAAIQQRLIFCL